MNGKSDSKKLRPLSSLKVGQKAVVHSLKSGDHVLRNRLLSMGLVAGTALELMCVAPLGDPIKIKALGYSLSLRLSEANSIDVAPLSNEELNLASSV